MSNRKEILELLSQGKITAEEAAEMLSTPVVETAVPTKEQVIEVEEETAVPTKEPMTTGHTPSWFKVRVRNLDSGKNKVSVNIPIRMFKFGMKIGRKFTDELDDLNWNEIDGMMKNMQKGMIVEVQDEDSNEHVQVYFE
ncbi:MAG: hypothetical protein DWQ04_02645 [Chloroflexi bacterium]|nr:MAG: hypothetical protein DWQ04_02645 [Chloroflexota bacterium]